MPSKSVFSKIQAGIACYRRDVSTVDGGSPARSARAWNHRLCSESSVPCRRRETTRDMQKGTRTSHYLCAETLHSLTDWSSRSYFYSRCLRADNGDSVNLGRPSFGPSRIGAGSSKGRVASTLMRAIMRSVSSGALPLNTQTGGEHMFEWQSGGETESDEACAHDKSGASGDC